MRWARAAAGGRALPGTGPTGRRSPGPHAEPLLGTPFLEPLHLGKPRPHREAHRAGIAAWAVGTTGSPGYAAADQPSAAARASAAHPHPHARRLPCSATAGSGVSAPRRRLVTRRARGAVRGALRGSSPWRGPTRMLCSSGSSPRYRWRCRRWLSGHTVHSRWATSSRGAATSTSRGGRKPAGRRAERSTGKHSPAPVGRESGSGQAALLVHGQGSPPRG